MGDPFDEDLSPNEVPPAFLALFIVPPSALPVLYTAKVSISLKSPRTIESTN
jgi:hypothetical protein